MVPNSSEESIVVFAGSSGGRSTLGSSSFCCSCGISSWSSSTRFLGLLQVKTWMLGICCWNRVSMYWWTIHTKPSFTAKSPCTHPIISTIRFPSVIISTTSTSQLQTTHQRQTSNHVYLHVFGWLQQYTNPTSSHLRSRTNLKYTFDYLGNDLDAYDSLTLLIHYHVLLRVRLWKVTRLFTRLSIALSGSCFVTVTIKDNDASNLLSGLLTNSENWRMKQITWEPRL